jgi:hypothetical protein
VEFKNKVYDSDYRKINPNSIFGGHSNFLSLFAENLIFLAIRCSKELTSQISSNFKVLRISSEFLIKFYPQKIL